MILVSFNEKDKARAILEVIEEIKPPSMIKWHLIFFITGLLAGTGVGAIIMILTR